VFDLVSDPEKREEVLAELTKQLDPVEQQVRGGLLRVGLWGFGWLAASCWPSHR
jgi:hypothetical protein